MVEYNLGASKQISQVVHNAALSTACTISIKAHQKTDARKSNRLVKGQQ